MGTVPQQLDEIRRRLLDLTLRNRLLKYRESKRRTIVIDDNSPEDAFGALVIGERTARPRHTGVPARDTVGADDAYSLQTPYDEEELQRRLLAVSRGSKEAFEEQGYTILFLALGFLEWLDPLASEGACQAPLVLVPVSLSKHGPGNRFGLKWTGEDIQSNISLSVMLKERFNLDVPPFEWQEEEDASLAVGSPIQAYFETVTSLIVAQTGWRVLPQIRLDFFNFAKFVMYKDLDPSTWPDDKKPSDHPVVKRIIEPEETPEDQGEFDEARVDSDLDLRSCFTVLDADPSQIAVIEMAKGKRNLVVEGPPGTGKSQTIANLIAELLAQEKSVLFVSEKMAALEVVKNRLDDPKVGLGFACVELHSRKANKREFLDEIKRTIEAPENRPPVIGGHIEDLERARDHLNAYASAIREPIGQALFSPFDLFAHSEERAIHFEKTDREITFLQLANAGDCTREQWRAAIRNLEDLGKQASPLLPLKTNPWRGCDPGHILPNELRGVEALFGEMSRELEMISLASRRLHELVGVEPPNALKMVSPLVEAAQLALEAPPSVATTLRNDDWRALLPLSREIIDRFERFISQKAAIASKFEPRWIETDTSPLMAEYKQHSSHIWSLLNPKYYSLKRRIREMYIVQGRRSRAQIAADLEELCLAQGSRRHLREPATQTSSYFAELWRGPDSEVSELKRHHEWLDRFSKLRPKTLAISIQNRLIAPIDRSAVKRALKDLVDAYNRLLPHLDSLSTLLRINPEKAFGQALKDVEIDTFADRLKQWRVSLHSLQDWRAYSELSRQCCESIAAPVAGRLEHDELDPDDLVPVFKGAFADSLLKIAFKKRPALSHFAEISHKQQMLSFRDLDVKMIELNRKRLQSKLRNELPNLRQGAQSNNWRGILLGQFQKKRGHLPIRKLMTLVGPLIQEIKPCFMMSPLSVAQFLDPRQVSFDVVIFDEASQVRPEDAVGAILRAQQAIVVGDTRQLPPTSFFDVDVQDADYADDGTVGVADVESILHQCSMRFPSKQLKWHYRSLHESLIAVSNRDFYDNRLLIYPSAFANVEHLGVKFRHSSGSSYDRGASRVNRVEAALVTDEIIRHLEDFPHKTLGVGTFSAAQQEAIQNSVDERIRMHPNLEPHLKTTKFFVKNLETIQGDERDVILLSVGYGFDQNRQLTMNFGPLSHEGGWRRLNVLITRAREKCVVFCNFHASDLNVGPNTPLGVKTLKTFLDFAETGNLRALETNLPEGDSPFEDMVGEFLRSHGFEIRKQVGCASYRIDLAIVDPSSPGRYLLGIECDGKQYHSSHVARERDRLRQEVLERLGWKNRLYRIWSTDWYLRRKESREALLRAIEAARVQPYC